MSVILLFAAMLALPGCMAARSPRADACALPAQKSLLVTRLFFGRDIPDRDPLTDAEWQGFASSVLTPNFPDGLTIVDGYGQWLDPQTRQVVHEPSIMVLIATDPGTDVAGRIAAVVDAYKLQFRQQSVGVLSESACGAF